MEGDFEDLYIWPMHREAVMREEFVRIFKRWNSVLTLNVYYCAWSVEALLLVSEHVLDDLSIRCLSISA